jgi:hypothetical protein
MNGQALLDAVFEVAFKGNDADIKARKDVLWIAGTVLLADVLGRADVFTRERLLHGIERELRDALTEIERLMHQPRPSPYPRAPEVH